MKMDSEDIKCPLITYLFATIKVKNGKKSLQYLGQVMAKLSDDFYLCDLFSWLDGSCIESRIFSFEFLKDARFFPCKEDLLRYVKGF